ncbi:MAG: MBL fold metallo-hydrolase [Clostridia bacterium]|nr:MBL fold metallo-hydrolase [Clostridia bacterium]
MKVIWLGQAGLYLESAAVRVMIDPYLSDSVYEASNDPALHRRVPVPAWVWELIPDVLIFTHEHLDHYDPETAHRFFASAKKPLTVLSPPSVLSSMICMTEKPITSPATRCTTKRFSRICPSTSTQYSCPSTVSATT